MIDCAPARNRHHNDPCVLAICRQDRAIAAIIDGAASWGSGVEAATWTHQRLVERWETGLPEDVADVARDLSEVVALIPTDLRDPDWGYSFAVAAVFYACNSISVVAAGNYGVMAATPRRVELLFQPCTVVAELLASGKLAPKEVPNHSLRKVCCGPFVPDARPAYLTVVGPRRIEPRLKIIASYNLLHEHLLRDNPGKWLHLSARELQDLGVLYESGNRPLLVFETPLP